LANPKVISSFNLNKVIKTRWPLALATIVVVASVTVFFGFSSTKKPPPARAPVPVAVATVELRDLPHFLEVAGSVESLHSVVIRPQIDGILTTAQFQEGDLASRGQLLATIDDRAFQAALAAAKGELARDKAQLRSAEQDLARSLELVQRGAVSRQVLDKQTSVVDQLKAAVQVGEAKVKTAEVNLSYTRIFSPVTGRVGIRRVDAGNFVRASDPNGLVSVAQIDPISVLFPVAQSVLGDLRADVNRSGGGGVDLFDRNTNEVLARGRITAFDNGVDQTTGTAKIRAEFDNKSERLSPGQFVAVRIRTGISSGALVVPAVAVRPGLEGNFVYRVVNNTAERVIITLGYTDDAFAVIAQGLNAGDVVVVDGASRLTPGASISIRESQSKAKSNAADSSAGLAQGLR